MTFDPSRNVDILCPQECLSVCDTLLLFFNHTKFSWKHIETGKALFLLGFSGNRLKVETVNYYDQYKNRPRNVH